MKTPKPKHTATVCDACGIDWKRHTDRMETSDQKPTTDDCIALLKADLAAEQLRKPVPYPSYPPALFRFPQVGPYVSPNMTPNTAMPYTPRLPQITCGAGGSSLDATCSSSFAR